MPDLIETDARIHPSRDAIALQQKSSVLKFFKITEKIGVLCVHASAFGILLEILTIPLIWFPEWDFMPRTSWEGGFVPFIGIFSFVLFIASVMIAGASNFITFMMARKSITEWTTTFPKPDEDPFMFHVRNMIVANTSQYDIESFYSEDTRLYIHQILSTPNPKDNDLLRLADVLPIKTLIPNRMKNGVQELAKTGILVDRQEIAALIRRIDFNISKTDLKAEDIPHLAEIMRARFYADQILKALLSGDIGTDEATQRLAALACLVDGAVDAIGIQIPLNTNVTLPRPELVDA